MRCRIRPAACARPGSATSKWIACLVLSATAVAASGHDGEDHGAPPPPLSQNVAPRAAAISDEFEIVAALEGRRLVVYVDRYASNEPVANAKVEVEGAGLKGVARQTAPGTYLLDGAAGLPEKKHALTISIDAGDTVDLIPATLDTTRPGPAAAHMHGWNERVIWIIAGLVLLVSATLLAMRRRRGRSP